MRSINRPHSWEHANTVLDQFEHCCNDVPMVYHECCGHGLAEQCKSVQRLKRVMVNYVEYYFDINCVDIQLILDDFLHLLHKHNTLPEFEFIADSFGYCDIRLCYIFNRHYGQRRNPNNTFYFESDDKMDMDLEDNTHQMTCMQILDTIHCYFNHTFDIGFRFRSFTTEQTCKPHEVYQEIVNAETDSTNNSKFTDKISVKTTEKHKLKNDEGTLMYSYGVRFEYDLNGDYNANKGKHNYIRYVPMKHSTFKHEIIALSKLADISVNQWTHQYKKAELHFNSFYCKAFVSKCNRLYNETLDGDIKHELEINHLLALMFYCNYDKLQYEFSKTYRRQSTKESNQQLAKRHSKFYHLGKYIVEAVHYFGNRINDVNQVFYHGVSEETVFLSASFAYFSGPLSTSTNYSVAACFANKKGLIVELCDTNSIYSSAKYFAMHWLSCYANEQECLFIACEAPLLFKDIVSVSEGTGYQTIIKSLHLFNYIFAGNKLLQHTLCDTDNKIAYKCLCQQLNDNGLKLKYSTFEALDQYAHKLINQYFENQKELWLDLDIIKNKMDWVNKLFYQNDYEWINLELMNVLFPNVEYIYFRWRIKLKIYILENIFRHLQTRKYTKFKIIRIAVDGMNSDIDIKSAIDEFQHQFQLLGFVIYQRANADLCIEKICVTNYHYL